MKQAARMLDPTAHGGTIAWGDASVYIGGQPAARMGDPHMCPLADPKPHVGGVITQGSLTVFIGNANAARMGDLCGCSTAGISGQGVPPVSGPGAPKMEETCLDGYGTSVTEDKDKDGTYDQTTCTVRAMEPQKETLFDWMGIKVDKEISGPTAEHTRTGDFVDITEYEGKGPPNGRIKNEVYGARGVYKIKVADLFDWSFEENIVHAEAEADVPHGGGAQGSLWDGKVTAKQNLSWPYTPHMWAINALTDLNLNRAEVVAEAGGAVGAQGGSVKPFYVIDEGGRYGLGISVEWAAGLGISGKAEFAFSEQKEPDGGVKGQGAGGVVNTIVLGCPTVLIGG